MGSEHGTERGCTRSSTTARSLSPSGVPDPAESLSLFLPLSTSREVGRARLSYMHLSRITEMSSSGGGTGRVGGFGGWKKCQVFRCHRKVRAKDG